MGDLFWNKVIGAFLGAWLAMFAISEVSHVLIHPHELEEDAYPIEVPDEAAGPGGAVEEAVDLGAALREANAGAGETFAQTLCGSCHTFAQGEAALTGPNLYDVVGRPVASMDFNYSPAMQEYGGEWTYERLWAYLERPAGEVPGTAMTFAGLSRENQRANVVAYLASLSSDPVAFPEPLPPVEDVVDAMVDEAEAALDDAVEEVEDAAATLEAASPPVQPAPVADGAEENDADATP